MTEENSGNNLNGKCTPNNSEVEIKGNRGTNNIHQNTSTSKNNISVIRDTNEEFVPHIRWPDTIVQTYLHLGCLYGLYLALVSAKFYTVIFGKYKASY